MTELCMDSDEFSRDLAQLEELRLNVQNNLRLRPIPNLQSDSPTSAYFTPQLKAAPILPLVLYRRLTGDKRPLLIDTRPLPSHLQVHIKYSINLAIPSLILKRSRRPGGGFQSLDSLRQFITTDDGKEAWDSLLNGPWDGDVVVYDDEMDVHDRENPSATSWALVSIIAPLLTHGTVDYLQGGLNRAGHDPDLQSILIVPGQLRPAGLFKIDTTTQQFKSTIEIDRSLSAHSASPIHRPSLNVIDATPSPPPSQAGFKRTLSKRPSAPSLSRINTKSAERLPKLSVRTLPLRSATLAVPPPLSSSSLYPNLPSPLYGNWSPQSAVEKDNPADYLTPYFTPPHTPGTPKPSSVISSFSDLPATPKTAKPDEPPTTEDPLPVWNVSTILPNFLYLGPELTTQDQVDELKDLGVRRILNMAAECDADDFGLRLRDVFDRYNKIGMRDTVEEEGVRKGVHEVCEILDDARLHSAPTYVHCKAGKSRSVTAVMAYLIHANHWTLSQAYTFVLERRKGISPNIGFVSELMTFEEEELGGKSIGVQPSAPAGPSKSHRLPDYPNPAGPPPEADSAPPAVHAGSNRQRAHVRESLPPAFVSVQPADSTAGPFSAGGIDTRAMGDSGQEMEIKDASGRYRHARRAPVDEQTLQPLRRVSKAGLESSAYAEVFLSSN